MKRVVVESSSLRSIGYNAKSSTLEVEFCSGRIYSYADVPRAVHDWLMRTREKGGYFNRMIRDRYVARDVTPGAEDSGADLEARLHRSLEDK